VRSSNDTPQSRGLALHRGREMYLSSRADLTLIFHEISPPRTSDVGRRCIEMKSRTDLKTLRFRSVFVITRGRCGQTGMSVDSYYYSGKQGGGGKCSGSGEWTWVVGLIIKGWIAKIPGQVVMPLRVAAGQQLRGSCNCTSRLPAATTLLVLLKRLSPQTVLQWWWGRERWLMRECCKRGGQVCGSMCENISASGTRLYTLWMRNTLTLH
jgi:hypothetical protein